MVFKKGDVSWNKGKSMIHSGTFKKGRIFSEEIKTKISNSLKGKVSFNKGKKLSEETIKKISISKKGKESLKKGKHYGYHSWNYKGTSTSNKLLRCSLDWKIWREKVFIRDDFTCQKCRIKGFYIEPHHIISVKECLQRNDLISIYNIDNGMTLCRPCHMKIHNWKIKIKESE